MTAALAPVPSRPLVGVGRPHLRVLPGGKQAPRVGPVYWRRRVVAAFMVALVLAAAFLLVRQAVEVFSAPASPLPPAAVVQGPGEGASAYVVRSGDTLWDIARQLQPTGDVRPVVDQLAQRLGGAVLQPGQRLDLGALVG